MGVWRKILERQVSQCPKCITRAKFSLKAPSKRGLFWSNEQADPKACHQTTKMGRGADLRRGNIEQDLDADNKKDIEKTLLCLPNVTMANEKSGPGANNSHHATRCAHQLGRPNDL